MIHYYKITVTHNGDTVQVYPQPPKPDELPDLGIDFDEVCQRVGTMVMSAGITSVKVYRDGELYRTAKVTEQGEAKEPSRLLVWRGKGPLRPEDIKEYE